MSSKWVFNFVKRTQVAIHKYLWPAPNHLLAVLILPIIQVTSIASSFYEEAVRPKYREDGTHPNTVIRTIKLSRSWLCVTN